MVNHQSLHAAVSWNKASKIHELLLETRYIKRQDMLRIKLKTWQRYTTIETPLVTYNRTNDNIFEQD